MEKKTPNKRKSLAKSNVTPNKIRKTDSPVSQNIINKSANKNGNNSKSPNKNQNITTKKQVNGNQAKINNKDEQLEIVLNKSANKKKQTQTNENKSNKKQNITPKKQVNGNQTTPKKQVNDKQTASKKQMNTKQTKPKRNKKSKQEEEVEVELMDDSDEYDTDNSIEEMNDSDVEETAINEADSDENAQVDEDESGDENDSGEEDEESDLEENDEAGDLDGEAEHEEKDEEVNDVDEKEATQNLCVYVQGLKPGLTMDRIFPGCNINRVTKWKSNYQGSKEYSENGIVYFNDMESLKKALSNEEVNVDGNKILVNIHSSAIEFGVVVLRLDPDADVRDVFNDCNILCLSVPKFATKNKYVNFEDKESMQKALLKSGSEVNGKLIKVLPTKEIADRVKNLTITMYRLNTDVKIEDIFEGCNIKFYRLHIKLTTNEYNDKVDVTLEDEESVQKALLKNNTEYNGSVIKIFRKQCGVLVKGIKENTKMEEIFTGCKIHDVVLKMDKDTNKLTEAVVHFQDYSSYKRATSMKVPPGIIVTSNGLKRFNDKIGKKSGFVKNKFNKRPYQQSRGIEAKKLLLQELKSQVQKLTEEVYGTSRPRPSPKPFMFARRNPRINN